MILTHGANSLKSNENIIGGKEYSVTKIGNQIWLAENLVYEFPGLVIGNESSASNIRACYYDNNKSKYAGNGLLYTWYAAKYLDDNKSTLIPGWRVPSANDWSILMNTAGGQSYAGKKLKSTIGWTTGAGTDDYGFNAKPYGRNDAGFKDLGYGAYFWTSSENGTTLGLYRFLNSADYVSTYDGSKANSYSVRLVKDA